MGLTELGIRRQLQDLLILQDRSTHLINYTVTCLFHSIGTTVLYSIVILRPKQRLGSLHGSRWEHSRRWSLPAAPAAPERRLASASPRTARRSRLSTASGSAESGARRRDGRGLGRKALNDSGQHADLGQHPVWAVQVPAEPEPLRRKGALRARRSPAQPPGLPLSAAGPAPTMALPLHSRRFRLRDPEPLRGPRGTPAPPPKPRPPKPRPPLSRYGWALLCSPHPGPRSSRARRVEPPRGFSAPPFRVAELYLAALSLFRACAPPCLPVFIFSCSRWMARLVRLLPAAAPALSSEPLSAPAAARQGPHSIAASVGTASARCVNSEGSSSG